MSSLIRIIAHWTVTNYKATEQSKSHYHFIYEDTGNEVKGYLRPEANITTRIKPYAAHTLGCNSGAIGVACAAMLGAIDVNNPGLYPITELQFDGMCRGMARLANKYNILVSRKTILSHAEVEEVLGVKQRGKWDISVLPFAGLKTAKACGDEMRSRVAYHLKNQ